MSPNERSREIELKMLEAETNYRAELYNVENSPLLDANGAEEARNRLDARVDEIIAEEDE